MPTPRRPRFAWVLALATGPLLGWGLWLAAGPSQAAAPRQGPGEFALEELSHARLEQALIRAESTARLLNLLEARTGAAGGP